MRKERRKDGRTDGWKEGRKEKEKRKDIFFGHYFYAQQHLSFLSQPLKNSPLSLFHTFSTLFAAQATHHSGKSTQSKSEELGPNFNSVIQQC